MQNSIYIKLSLILFSAQLLSLNGFSQAKPKNGSGAFSTGKYRNLFKEYGHSDKDINKKLEATFQQLFYGDTAHATAFDAGRNENGPLIYVSDVPHYDIRTEGMSYGMMIAVQMNKNVHQ
jgi:oligosaccharide reducing-end xylanase